MQLKMQLNMAMGAPTYEEFLGDSRGVKQVLANLLTYGVGMVCATPPSVEATERVITRIAPVMNTQFGGMLEFSNGNMIHGDTAYGYAPCFPKALHSIDFIHISIHVGKFLFSFY